LATPAARERRFAQLDLLDKAIRSEETLHELSAESSSISKRWGIATAIQVDDFYQALRQAHGGV
jgi:hypothetical protein